MLVGLLHRMFSHLSPERAEHLFFYAQVAFLSVFALLVYRLTRKKEESGFRVRESDKKRRVQVGKVPDPLADAKMKRVEPLRLSGIRIDGEPHEILGIPKNSESTAIQQAYRDLMKRYHPDVVGRPGTREWADAQKIAEALNQARKRMLDAQSQSPKRSGR